jgi:hypothetical protein
MFFRQKPHLTTAVRANQRSDFADLLAQASPSDASNFGVLEFQRFEANPFNRCLLLFRPFDAAGRNRSSSPRIAGVE